MLDGDWSSDVCSSDLAALVRYFFSVHGVRPIIETRKISEVGDVSSGYDAALVIGDTALTQNWPGTFDHVFDLGEMWFNMTGLPFVFAVWAIRKDFVDASPEIVERLKGLFRESKNMGEKNMGEIVDQASLKTGLTKSLCHDYFNHLHCDLAPLYIKGLETFYKGLHDKKIIDEEVVIRFA
jgi:chorismate dehydratase